MVRGSIVCKCQILTFRKLSERLYDMKPSLSIHMYAHMFTYLYIPVDVYMCLYICQDKEGCMPEMPKCMHIDFIYIHIQASLSHCEEFLLKFPN